ncbi:MAG: ABC transporter substrate-binding protein [Xanthobacteraceae bacterium]
MPPLEIRGKKPLRIFWFADYGVTVVSNGIIAHNDLIESDPELIRAFIPASIKGFLYGRQHPDEVLAVVTRVHLLVCFTRVRARRRRAVPAERCQPTDPPARRCD